MSWWFCCSLIILFIFVIIKEKINPISHTENDSLKLQSEALFKSGIEEIEAKREVEMLQNEREHKSKLPGVKLPEDMVFTNDLEEGMKDKDFLVLAVPSIFTRSTARSMKPFIKEGQIIVNVAKGIEESTFNVYESI